MLGATRPDVLVSEHEVLQLLFLSTKRPAAVDAFASLPRQQPIYLQQWSGPSSGLGLCKGCLLT